MRKAGCTSAKIQLALRLPVWSVAPLLLWVVGGCAPNVEVGTWKCGASVGAIDEDDAGTNPFFKGAIAQSWSAGFEAGFCDYDRLRGFCYAVGSASYRVVDAPLHSGLRAAAFSVTGTSGQARCVREGTLPDDAYYGAWFYIASAPTSVGNWNLMHFQGGDGTADSLPNLWDVSLETSTDGVTLAVRADSRLGNQLPTPTSTMPLGQWVHLEFRMRRAADATGAVALLQDGVTILAADGIVTDDTKYGQWYVGNLATQLSPPESTVYVDDVSIRPVP